MVHFQYAGIYVEGTTPTCAERDVSHIKNQWTERLKEEAEVDLAEVYKNKSY